MGQQHALFFGLLLIPNFVCAEADPLRKIADELARGISRARTAKVAVLAVPHHDQHLSDGPFMVSERLATYLAKDKRVSILERNHIVQILSELHLSETGVLDPKTAKRIGDVLGADVIITGTLIDLDNGKSEINVRALYSNNGRVIAASRGLLDRTWDGRPVLSWANGRPTLGDPIRTLSRKLKEGLKIHAPLSVAVLHFTYARGRMSTGSHLVSERLVSYLVQDGVTVVERRLIQKILEERKMWETGIADLNSIKKMGRILDVDAIVVGTMSDLSDEVAEVMARVIRVDSSKILASAAILMPRLWQDTPKTPRFFASRVPVPAAYSAVFTDKETGKRHRLSDLDAPKRMGRYHMAPVPFFMPSSAQRPKGVAR